MAAPLNFRTALNGFNRDDVVQFLEYINNKHQTQMDTLREETNRLRAQLNAQPQEDPAAAQELEQAHLELDQKQAQCDELTQRLSDANQELDAMRLRFDQKQTQCDELTQRLSDANQELDAMRLRADQRQTQYDELTQRLSAAQGRLQQLESAPPVRADTSALDAQIEDLNTELMLAQNRIQELESQAKRSAQDAQSAQGKARSLELQLSQSQSKLREMESSQARAMDIYRRSAENERFARAQSELVYHQANGVLNQAQLQVNVASRDLANVTEETMKQLTQLQLAVTQSRQALEDAAALMQAIRPVQANP